MTAADVYTYVRALVAGAGLALAAAAMCATSALVSSGTHTASRPRYQAVQTIVGPVDVEAGRDLAGGRWFYGASVGVGDRYCFVGSGGAGCERGGHLPPGAVVA